MIDDGKIEVKVSSIEANGDVKVMVTLGGVLSSKKGINLPDTKISLPALTEKDLVDLDFIIEQQKSIYLFIMWIHGTCRFI